MKDIAYNILFRSHYNTQDIIVTFLSVLLAVLVVLVVIVVLVVLTNLDVFVIFRVASYAQMCNICHIRTNASLIVYASFSLSAFSLLLVSLLGAILCKSSSESKYIRFHLYSVLFLFYQQPFC